jgi:hypothetical protein
MRLGIIKVRLRLSVVHWILFFVYKFLIFIILLALGLSRTLLVYCTGPGSIESVGHYVTVSSADDNELEEPMLWLFSWQRLSSLKGNAC